MKTKRSKHLTIILKKMCDVVGANYDKINFKKEGWWLKYEWTEKQYDEFKEWLISYLYNSSEARNEVLEHNIRNKKYIYRAISFFLLSYGWKIKCNI